MHRKAPETLNPAVDALDVSPVSRFMSVREAAEYLQINEKKIYALAAEGKIPGTKVTGKWLFPRDLVDQWLTRSSHGGVFTDRLVIAGADDPLTARLGTEICANFDARALIAYAPTGTRLGLSLLAAGRCDASLVHWGLADESHLRHPALIRAFPEHGQWVLVRAFRREQGLMLAPGLSPEDRHLDRLLAPGTRVVARVEGSGTGRFFEETMARSSSSFEGLQVVQRVRTDREAAQLLRAGEAQVAPASRPAAAEAGLDFVGVGWEAMDLACSRGLYFRTLLQHLLDALKSDDTFLLADRLGGYDFPESGKLVWAAQ